MPRAEGQERKGNGKSNSKGKSVDAKCAKLKRKVAQRLRLGDAEGFGVEGGAEAGDEELEDEQSDKVGSGGHRKDE